MTSLRGAAHRIARSLILTGRSGARKSSLSIDMALLVAAAEVDAAMASPSSMARGINV